jgi:ankyrin repeat protein
MHQLVAAMYNHAHIITALLEYGADPEVKDGDGRTPMYYGTSILL